jgi:hypothetical protein
MTMAHLSRRNLTFEILRDASNYVICNDYTSISVVYEINYEALMAESFILNPWEHRLESAYGLVSLKPLKVVEVGDRIFCEVYEHLIVSAECIVISL